MQTDVRRKSSIFHPADNDISGSEGSRTHECPFEETFAIRYLIHAINTVLELRACFAELLWCHTVRQKIQHTLWNPEIAHTGYYNPDTKGEN